MFTSYELSPFNYQLLVLSAVMMSKIVITAISPHYPWRFFNLYCRLLSDKVLRVNASPNQQRLAGLISVFITLTPVTIILWLFSAFIEVVFLWNAFLLYMAIGATDLPKLSREVASCLLADKKQDAKKVISPWLLRQTEPLSSMGIAKANIEVLLLKSLQQFYLPIFIYFLFGPLLAFAFRLLLEMRYAWNVKLPLYVQFGAFSYQLSNIITWLPSRLLALICLLSSAPNRWLIYFRLSKEHFWQLNNDYFLQLLSFSLGTKLGGVALYDEKKTLKQLTLPDSEGITLANQLIMKNNIESTTQRKLRKKQFNDKARQPDIHDIFHTIKKINLMTTVCLVILVLVGNTAFISI
jgi:adenosylcobinamide-phosphate synthase